jgi:hypothetical protein
MRISIRHLPMAALLFVAAAGASPQASAPAAAPTSSAAQSETTFSREQLDQMMAPVALYPDSLLAQVLMASTYPGDVADAVAWSKAHKDAKGEEAVRQVANQPWDPSVQSLVAFPQLLAVLGQDPAWVQKMGDAFLAQPDAVMDSVQRLRRQAEAAGNLKSNEQQTVKTESRPPDAPASTTTTVQPAQQTIVIEPADPEVVYVPSYNPTTVYGTWAYPSYPPYYYPPPAYYYPGGALLSFGIGVAVGGALWGDCDWWGGDVDIDVDRYNNINTNRQINRSENTWRHNSANRDGVPYRDRASREQYGRQLDGAGQRDNFRGHDPARAADRERARQSMSQRGFEAPATSNREARDRAGQASQQMGRQQAGGRDMASTRQSGAGAQGRADAQRNAQARQGTRQQYSGSRGGQSNAFAGAGNPGQSRASANRGHGSYSASQRSGSRGAGRQMSRPARAGGGGRRR